jgi:Lon protease-like protein
MINERQNMSQPDMVSLPLFPLNTVLFPGAMLPLHIFEPRYRAMIRQCLDKESRFGVVLIQEGEEVDDIAEPYKVGTSARIVQVQHLADERMNIWVIGEARFRIWDYSVSENDYLIGFVSPLMEAPKPPRSIPEITNAVIQLLKTYLSLLSRLDDEQKIALGPQLTQEPEPLSYQVAELLNIDMVEKQTLLEANDAPSRLAREVKILEREVALLKLSRPASIQKLPWGGEIHLN